MRSSDDANFVASVGRPSPGGPQDSGTPASCTSIPAALRARRELRKLLSRQIMRIQDASLEPDAIRHLNDQINESLRMVRAWDECLLRLGHRMEREEGAGGALYGNEAVNAHGYWYFGRARELPGVRELLQEQERDRTKPERDLDKDEDSSPLKLRIKRMMEKADNEYFGRIEDRAMVEEEGAVEKKLQNDMQLDWITGLSLPLPPLGNLDSARDEGTEVDIVPPPNTPIADFITIVPTQEQVGAYLVERRREELLRKFVQNNRDSDD